MPWKAILDRPLFNRCQLPQHRNPPWKCQYCCFNLDVVNFIRGNNSTSEELSQQQQESSDFSLRRSRPITAAEFRSIECQGLLDTDTISSAVQSPNSVHFPMEHHPHMASGLDNSYGEFQALRQQALERQDMLKRKQLGKTVCTESSERGSLRPALRSVVCVAPKIRDRSMNLSKASRNHGRQSSDSAHIPTTPFADKAECEAQEHDAIDSTNIASSSATERPPLRDSFAPRPAGKELLSTTPPERTLSQETPPHDEEDLSRDGQDRCEAIAVSSDQASICLPNAPETSQTTPRADTEPSTYDILDPGIQLLLQLLREERTWKDLDEREKLYLLDGQSTLEYMAKPLLCPETDSSDGGEGRTQEDNL